MKQISNKMVSENLELIYTQKRTFPPAACVAVSGIDVCQELLESDLEVAFKTLLRRSLRRSPVTTMSTHSSGLIWRSYAGAVGARPPPSATSILLYQESGCYSPAFDSRPGDYFFNGWDKIYISKIIFFGSLLQSSFWRRRYKEYELHFFTFGTRWSFVKDLKNHMKMWLLLHNSW